MDADDTDGSNDGFDPTDRRSDPDPERHVGLIIHLVKFWQHNGALPKTAKFEELFSIAYIEAADLLKRKYDPRRALVSTFLRRFLLGRIEYRYKTQVLGMKRWHNRFVWPKHTERQSPVEAPEAQTRTEEILNFVHSDFRGIAKELMGGEDLKDVAKRHGFTPEQLRGILAKQLSTFDRND